MSATFELKKRMIYLDAWVTGPDGTAKLRVALDTGSTRTQVNSRLLRGVGYDLGRVVPNYQMNSATGSAMVGELVVDYFTCMQDARRRFPVLVHDLPPTTGLDGLVGLDFLWGRHLGLDFRRGRIRFGVRRWWQLWV